MKTIIQVEEKLPILKTLPLSLQHLFAMFGASVLVPLIFGIDPAIVLLMNGIGTLFFSFITKGKSPAFLGSSFAFIAPTLLIIGQKNLGYEFALGGFFVSGLIFIFVGLIIGRFGIKWIDVVLPPATMGAVVALIGLELAGVAGADSGLILNPNNGYTVIDYKLVIVFVVTLLTAIIGSTTFKKFFGVIPILIAIIVGYVTAILVGIVDFSPVKDASWFALPTFYTPRFDKSAIMIILPASIVVISEHIGHQIVTGKIINRDLTKEPGLNRSMLGDGISTSVSAICGSVPTTTYGENIGVMAITGVYSVWVIQFAAVISIVIAFIGKVSGLIQTIPAPVMAGVSFLLYGMIATSGIRLLVDAKVDYSKSENLILTSVVLITGLSGCSIAIGAVELKGMALAALVGMILSLMFYIFNKLNLSNDTFDKGELEQLNNLDK